MRFIYFATAFLDNFFLWFKVVCSHGVTAICIDTYWNCTSQSHRMGMEPSHVWHRTQKCIAVAPYEVSLTSTQPIFYHSRIHTKIAPCERTLRAKGPITFAITNVCGFRTVFGHFLVSTYVVCERLSAMQQQTKLPELLVQNSLSTPTSSISGMLVWSAPPPTRLTRSRDFGFELVWSNPLPSPPQENLARLREFGFELVWSNPPPNRLMWELVCGD